MALEQLNRSIDFVADSPPSDANDGELFLDTSLSPPQVKVFDSAAGSFVRPQTAQNLDAKVSQAGASQSEITTAVNNADTGINWASKTPRLTTLSPGAVLDVNGSGYLIGIFTRKKSTEAIIERLQIDGTKRLANTVLTQFSIIHGGAVFYLRFDTELNILNDNTSNTEILISHVLD